MAIDCSKEETWKSFCRSESWKWPEREQGRDSSQSSCSPGSTLQKSFTSWTWTWDWESIPLMGRLVCAIQSNWIKSKPTVLVQHIGYLSSHPRKLMMIKYEFSSSPQCSWGSRSDVSSTKWGSTRTSPPRHTPCHVARGKYYQFNCVFECLSICIFYKKNRFDFYAYSFFFQEEFRWRLTCIDLLFDSLMLSLPFPLCVNKVSWSGENFVLREGGVESLPWWRSIRKTWQSCSRLWKC